MANPYERRVGRTRTILAQMLEQLLPDMIVEPKNLRPQIPWYGRVQMDCVSWDADVFLRAQTKRDAPFGHIYCWGTMGELVKKGVCVVNREHNDVQVCARDHAGQDGVPGRGKAYR